MDDDEYALQLAEAVEEPGLQSQALERVALQKAAKGQFEKAREIASRLFDPDIVLAGVAAKQSSMGLESDALQTIDEIEHAGSAVTAFMELAAQKLRAEDGDGAVKFLELAVEEAAGIEHVEERARAYCDIGHAFIEVERNDRAVETFDKARETAETLGNMHRDTFLALAAQGFLSAGSLEFADRTLDLVGDKTQIATCLLGYAREFWRKGERDEAVESLEEAYAILESQHERETRDKKARFRLFTALAAQFAGFEKSERAIEIAQTVKDDAERTAALSQVAALLSLRKEDEHARHAFRAIPDDGDRVFALIGMSDAKGRNEERAGAIELLNEAGELAETVPQLTLRSSAYTEIGGRLAAHGESEAARRWFEQSVNALTEIRDESARVAALAHIVQVAARTGIDLPELAPVVLQRAKVAQG
jgi:tetratricopeptide (TPR) repeat protein